MAVTLQQFVEQLTQSGLLTADDISSFHDSFPPEKRPKDGEALARELVKANKITKYQAQVVYQGKVKGLVFGDYRVLDKLGQGGMGVVLKAEHRRMKRVVAVKMIAGAALKSSDAVKRFYREVEAAAKLEHPNIVTAYDACEYDGVHYLVMQFVDGKDLGAIVKERGPLPISQAVDYMAQAARGLQFAHEQGIVHRDIKPANLLVDNKGVVKILDMGLARIAGLADEEDKERLTASGQVMGTCDYMAPEQAMDTHHVDARADIYSLGCTLYRLLTGEAMYKGETLAKILISHQMAPIPSLCKVRNDVPQKLDAVFQKMVAKKSEDRYQTMAEVIADLETCMGKRAATATSADEEPTEAFQMDDNLSFLKTSSPRGAATATKKKVEQQAEATIAQHAAAETSRQLAPNEKLQAIPGKKKTFVVAAAAGVLGIIGIIALAVIISVRHPDGQETVVTVPDGSKVTVNEKGDVDVAVKVKPSMSSSEAPKEQAASSYPWKEAINLLPLIDPQKDVVRGEWKVEKDGLIGDKNPFACIEIPYQPPDEYDYRIEFTPQETGIGGCQQLTKGASNFTWNFFSQREHKLFGFERVGGKAVANNPTTTTLTPLEKGRRYVSLVEVRNDCVRGYLDGKLVVAWKTNYSDLDTFDAWKLRDSTLLGVGCQTRMIFHRIEVREVTGKGKFTRGTPQQSKSEQSPDYATWKKDAIDLLPLIDPKMDVVRGEWKVEKDGLVGDQNQFACIEIPYQPPQEYDYLVEFTPLKDGTGGVQYLVRETRKFTWSFFGASGHDLFGFSAINGRRLADNGNPTATKLSPLEIDRRYASLVQVRNDCVRGYLDGKLVAEWKTDYSDLDVFGGWNLRNPLLLGVGCQTRMIFHRIEVREVTGKGKFTRSTPQQSKSEQSPDYATWKKDAIDLLPLIDPKMDTVAGSWSVGAAGLEATDIKSMSQKIQPPYQPADEYDYRVSFTPIEGNVDVAIGLTAKGRSFVFFMKRYNSDHCSGFECIDNKIIASGPTARRFPHLELGRRYTVLVHVRKQGLKAWLDGELMAQWATDYHDMSPYRVWKFNDDTLLGIGCSLSKVVFHEIGVREITGKGKFTRRVAKANAVDDAFIKEVAALPPEQQVARVVAKLKELNPGYDGKEEHKIENGKVVYFKLKTTTVTDIWPVRALAKLDFLHCSGLNMNARIPLVDLTALKGLSLKGLYLGWSEVADLSPLRGMALTRFECLLSRVTDLEPLRGMGLESVLINNTTIGDLSPLKKMPLTRLWCFNTEVKDLSPIEDSPLTELRCDFDPKRDTEILRSIKTLQTINGLPVAKFWEQVAAGTIPSPMIGLIDSTSDASEHSQPSSTDDAFIKEVAALPAEQQVARVVAKLKELNPGYDGKEEHKIENGQVTRLTILDATVADISPVRALVNLKGLVCSALFGEKRRSRVTDLTPLKNLPLIELSCSYSDVADLSPLRGLPLKFLDCWGTKVANLSPLQGMQIKYLQVNATLVTDISPLRGMPLTKLLCHQTKVSDLSPLKDMPLKELSCDFDPKRDSAILRSIKTLETINGRPVAEFWKQVEAGKISPAK